jgi:PadR family transcriptional regulator PadR
MDTRKWITEMKKGALELCILSLLRRKERYGYEIVQELNRDGPTVVAEGTIYPLLNRLRQAGMVEATWKESPSGPPRKYYHLTAAGHQLYPDMVQEWKGLAVLIEKLVAEGVSHEEVIPGRATEARPVSVEGRPGVALPVCG